MRADIAWTYVVGLEFLERVSQRKGKTLLVVSGEVGGLCLSQPVGSIWRREFSSQNDLIPVSTLLHPVSDPFFTFVILNDQRGAHNQLMISYQPTWYKFAVSIVLPPAL